MAYSTGIVGKGRSLSLIVYAGSCIYQPRRVELANDRSCVNSADIGVAEVLTHAALQAYVNSRASLPDKTICAHHSNGSITLKTRCRWLSRPLFEFFGIHEP